MLQEHSEFFLSQKMIYFGVHEHSENDLSHETEVGIEFRFEPIFYPVSVAMQQNTGLYFDWYDVPE